MVRPHFASINDCYWLLTAVFFFRQSVFVGIRSARETGRQIALALLRASVFGPLGTSGDAGLATAGVVGAGAPGRLLLGRQLAGR